MKPTARSLRPFEHSGRGHPVVVNDVLFPESFEFEWVVTLDASTGAVLTAAGVKAGLTSNFEAILNDSRQALRPEVSTRTSRISFRRVGLVAQLMIDGKEVPMGRYPPSVTNPTSFSLELGPNAVVHSLRGTTL